MVRTFESFEPCLAVSPSARAGPNIVTSQLKQTDTFGPHLEKVHE